MEKTVDLTLLDVGDTVFRVMQRCFFRRGQDPAVEVMLVSSEFQESLNLRFPDATNLLIKIFPHKNYMQVAVFRIEVYKTKPGDMRGNRVAFVESPRGSQAFEEIRLFIEGVLSQSGL